MLLCRVDTLPGKGTAPVTWSAWNRQSSSVGASMRMSMIVSNFNDRASSPARVRPPNAPPMQFPQYWAGVSEGGWKLADTTGCQQTHAPTSWSKSPYAWNVYGVFHWTVCSYCGLFASSAMAMLGGGAGGAEQHPHDLEQSLPTAPPQSQPRVAIAVGQLMLPVSTHKGGGGGKLGTLRCP